MDQRRHPRVVGELNGTVLFKANKNKLKSQISIDLFISLIGCKLENGRKSLGRQLRFRLVVVRGT